MARPKNCVILVTPPADWKPTHFHQVPLEITTARFYARCVKLHEAFTLATHFNKKHLPGTGNYDGQWAMVTASLRRIRWQEGGAV